MKATQVLIDEHSGVMVILKVLEKLNLQINQNSQFNIDHVDEIIEFFQVFVDKCHHSKEEINLFPSIEALGTDSDRKLIKEAIDDHENARIYVSEIKDSIDAYKAGNKEKIKEFSKKSTSYISLLTQHIQKENTVIFIRADELISTEEQNEMILEFEEIEKDVIGVGRHEEFHMMIDELKKIYL